MWVWGLLVTGNLAFLVWVYRYVTQAERRAANEEKRCREDAEGRVRRDR